MPFLSSSSASKSEEEPETLVTKTSIIQHIISMASIEAKFQSELKEKKNTKRCFSEESKSHVNDIVSFSVKSSYGMEEEKGEGVRGRRNEESLVYGHFNQKAQSMAMAEDRRGRQKSR